MTCVSHEEFVLAKLCLCVLKGRLCINLIRVWSRTVLHSQLFTATFLWPILPGTNLHGQLTLRGDNSTQVSSAEWEGMYGGKAAGGAAASSAPGTGWEIRYLSTAWQQCLPCCWPWLCWVCCCCCCCVWVFFGFGFVFEGSLEQLMAAYLTNCPRSSGKNYRRLLLEETGSSQLPHCLLPPTKPPHALCHAC